MKHGMITLKRGLFTNKSKLQNWFNSIKTNTIQRSGITIQLLDEYGKVRMTWILQNTFPSKIYGADLKATGNEVAVETLELAHDGLNLK